MRHSQKLDPTASEAMMDRMIGEPVTPPCFQFDRVKAVQDLRERAASGGPVTLPARYVLVLADVLEGGE